MKTTDNTGVIQPKEELGQLETLLSSNLVKPCDSSKWGPDTGSTAVLGAGSSLGWSFQSQDCYPCGLQHKNEPREVQKQMEVALKSAQSLLQCIFSKKVSAQLDWGTHPTVRNTIYEEM